MLFDSAVHSVIIHTPFTTKKQFLELSCFFEVSLQAGKSVSGASVDANGKFVVKVEKRTIDFVDYVSANYVLVATGSSQQVCEH